MLKENFLLYGAVFEREGKKEKNNRGRQKKKAPELAALVRFCL